MCVRDRSSQRLTLPWVVSSRFLQGLAGAGLSGHAQRTRALPTIGVCASRAEQWTEVVLMGGCSPGGCADRQPETARGTHRPGTVQKPFH